MQRMVLKAYVGDGGVIHSSSLGTISFSDVFINRPLDCRYAVVQVADEYWMTDLFTLWRDPRTGELRMGVHWKFPSEEAAIMAAIMIG